MNKHDARVAVEDAVRDIKMSHRSELVVPVSRPLLSAIGQCARESWFLQYESMLYRAGKLVRFVISSECTA